MDTKDLKTIPPSEIHVKSFKSEEVDIPKRNSEFVFPCRTGEILKEGQPLSTAVYKAEGDFIRETQQTSAEEKEGAQDPDPDVEVRQDFWSIMGDDIYWNHVAPRTKLCVPKDDFPIQLYYVGGQRALMYL